MELQLKSISAEELFAMGDIGRCELVRGEIVMMAPAGAEHGDVAGEIFGRVWSFVREHKLGKVYAAETGFIIARNPDTTRAADVAFVRQSRIPERRVRGYFPAAPDLAVEVMSPHDRLAVCLEKVGEWINAGVTSVWLVDPDRKTIEVHHPGRPAVRYGPNAELLDELTLPGFIMKLDEIM